MLLSLVSQPSSVTYGMQESLSAWNDADGVWQRLVASYSGLFEDVAAIVMPQGSPDVPATYRAGWALPLDVELCPDAWLPYCGQFVGVQVPSGTAAVSARAMIEAESGFQAGTVAGIVAAVKQWLTGTQTVTVLERVASDGTTADAYHGVVIVLSSEVIDAGQLTAALNAVKPVGTQWTLILTSSWTLTQLEASVYTPISTTEADFSTVSNLETDVT